MKKTILIGGICLAIGVAGGYLLNSGVAPILDKSDKIRSIMENDWYYADEIEDLDTVLTDRSLQAMTTFSIDPHTQYLTQENAASFSQKLSGINTGIGILFSQTVEHDLYVEGVFMDSQAYQKGLRKGDVITSIDDLICQEKSEDKILDYIQSKDKQMVDITYVRDGQEKTMSVKVDEYDSSVIANLYDDYGELVLTSFSESSQDNVAKALMKMKESGIKKLLIDLRNNTGGYTDTAIDIASCLLPKDSIVFQEKTADDEVKAIKTNRAFDQIKFDQIVILQNGNTASSSEILIGALKENLGDIVTTVGVNTYGKGTEQKSVHFFDGTTFKYTVAQWLTPNKKSINNLGFIPDVSVEEIPAKSVTYQEMGDTDVIEADTVNDNAKALQVYLQYLGYSVDRVDTYFSKASSQALVQFQKDHGLVASGNCDRKTWDTLLQVVADGLAEQSDVQYEKAVSLIEGE